jgi:hypothetical protein
MVNEILEAHCNVMHTNRAGDSPLHVAINTKHAGEISLLLRAGADPTMRNANGKSPLDNMGMFKDDAEQKALGWEMANQCSITTQQFGIFSRRHHCRFCLLRCRRWRAPTARAPTCESVRLQSKHCRGAGLSSADCLTAQRERWREQAEAVRAPDL